MAPEVNENSFMMAGARTLSENERRQRVLEAAVELFSEQTWEGTNVPAIAERAGVAVGTIYRHFPSKEALGAAVYAAMKQAFMDAVLTDEVRALPPLPAIRLIWQRQLAFAIEQPGVFAFLEHQQHSGYLDDEGRAVLTRLDAELGEIIRAGQQAGVVRDGDPQVLLSMVFGAFVGVTKLARARSVPLATFDLAAVERAAAALLGLPDAEPGKGAASPA